MNFKWLFIYLFYVNLMKLTKAQRANQTTFFIDPDVNMMRTNNYRPDDFFKKLFDTMHNHFLKPLTSIFSLTNNGDANQMKRSLNHRLRRAFKDSNDNLHFKITTHKEKFNKSCKHKVEDDNRYIDTTDLNDKEHAILNEIKIIIHSFMNQQTTSDKGNIAPNIINTRDENIIKQINTNETKHNKLCCNTTHIADITKFNIKNNHNSSDCCRKKLEILRNISIDAFEAIDTQINAMKDTLNSIDINDRTKRSVPLYDSQVNNDYKEKVFKNIMESYAGTINSLIVVPIFIGTAPIEIDTSGNDLYSIIDAPLIEMLALYDKDRKVIVQFIPLKMVRIKFDETYDVPIPFDELNTGYYDTDWNSVYETDDYAGDQIRWKKDFNQIFGIVGGVPALPSGFPIMNKGRKK